MAPQSMDVVAFGQACDPSDTALQEHTVICILQHAIAYRRLGFENTTAHLRTSAFVTSVHPQPRPNPVRLHMIRR